MGWTDVFNPLEWFGTNDAEDRAKNGHDDAQGEGLFSENSTDVGGGSGPSGWVHDTTRPDGKMDVWKRDVGTTWEQQASEAAADPERRPGGLWTGGEDRGAYQYGRTPGGADAAANLALQTGAGAEAHGLQIEGADRGMATQLQNRVGPTGQWWQQDSALGGASNYGAQLAGLEAQQGPSAAQAQLQAGTNQALDSQIALARSGRGFGGNAAAAGLAQQNVAGIQANQANSSAQLRAQEDAAWRGRRASNLGNAAGIQTAVGQQYGAQSQADLSAQLAARGQNDSAALGWAGMGQDAWKTGVGANVGAQSQATAVRGMEMQGGQSMEDNKLRQWAAQNGYDLAQQQRSDQQDAAAMSAAGTVFSTLLSDVRAKTRIAPSRGAGSEFGRFAYGGTTERSPVAAPTRPAPETSEDPNFSHELDFDGTLYRPHEMGGADYGQNASGDAKRGATAMPARPTPMQQQYQGTAVSGDARPDTSKPFDLDSLDASSLDAVRNSPASFYDYKDPNAPGADAQRHYGPMAQDLAKTPAGRSAVVQQPDGSLGVDTGRLALVHNGAISEQQKQLDALAAELEAFRNKPSSVDPDAVYGER